MRFRSCLASLKGFFDFYGEDFLALNSLGEEKTIRGIFVKGKKEYVRNEFGNDCLNMGEIYFIKKPLSEEIVEGDTLKSEEREVFCLKSETILKKGKEELKRALVREI